MKIAAALLVFALFLTAGAAGSWWALRSFRQQTAAERQGLSAHGFVRQRGLITPDALHGLPTPVQTWLRNAGTVGQPRFTALSLEQKVQLRISPDGRWLSGTARQDITLDQPGFLWEVHLQVNPLVHITGRDLYLDGRGHMLIKVQSLFAAADTRGPEVDQGSLVRYLAELAWYPTAALNPYIRWEAVDERRARATLEDQGTEVVGMFTFDDRGQMTKFSAQRYMEQNGSYSLQTWTAHLADHTNFGGMILPASVDIIWKLADGDFHWYQSTITEVAYH